MKLKINGYYYSEGTKWEDWQSGHKFEGINYDFIYFRSDGKFFIHLDRKKEINLSVFDKKKNYGTYMSNGEDIKGVYNPKSPFPSPIEFRFKSEEILVSTNNDKEYFFFPITSEEE